MVMKIRPNTKVGHKWWREFYRRLNTVRVHMDSVKEWSGAIEYLDSEFAATIALGTATQALRERLVELIDHIDTAEATEILIAITPDR